MDEGEHQPPVLGEKGRACTFIYVLIRTRPRSEQTRAPRENAGSIRDSLPKNEEGSGGVDVKEALFAGLSLLRWCAPEKRNPLTAEGVRILLEQSCVKPGQSLFQRICQSGTGVSCLRGFSSTIAKVCCSAVRPPSGCGKVPLAAMMMRWLSMETFASLFMKPCCSAASQSATRTVLLWI